MAKYYRLWLKLETHANVIENLNLPSEIVGIFEKNLGRKAKTWKSKVTEDCMQWSEVAMIFMFNSFDELNNIYNIIMDYNINETKISNIICSYSNNPIEYIYEPYQFPLNSKVKIISNFVDKNMPPIGSTGLVYQHMDEYTYQIIMTNDEAGKLITVNGSDLCFYDQVFENVVTIE